MRLDEIPELFGIDGKCAVESVGAGHINFTYKVTAPEGEYILQSLNDKVFRDPAAVMENIAKITAAFENSAGSRVAVPDFLRVDGRNYTEAAGAVWRMYPYIQPENVSDADYLAGLSFGTFIRATEGTELVPVIRDYHDFSHYYSRLKELGGADIPELEKLAAELAEVFRPELTRRCIHGDAKPANVITGERCTVIDLDTAMNGYAAVDLGDLVRSAGSDTERISAAVSGFAEGLDGLLSAAEVDSLYYGVLWTNGELAVRYLTDSISSEGYFRDKTPEDCRRRAEDLLRQLRFTMKMENDIKEIIRSSFRR